MCAPYAWNPETMTSPLTISETAEIMPRGAGPLSRRPVDGERAAVAGAHELAGLLIERKSASDVRARRAEHQRLAFPRS